MARTWLVVVLAGLAALASGCGGDKGSPDGAAEGATPAAPSPEEVRLAQTRAALEGRWTVGPPEHPSFSLEVEGSQIRVTDRRFSEPTTQSGALIAPEPHTVGVELADGTVYKYRWVLLEGALHFGLGDVHEVGDLGSFALPLGPLETLERAGAGCRWIKQVGGKEEVRQVPCRVDDAAEPPVFTFTVPDPFDETRRAERRLYRRGAFLLDEDMLASVARRSVDPSAAKPR